MPELPEVETTRRGIEPHISGKKIREVIVRRTDLRQPVTPGIDAIAAQRVRNVRRRSKYLLIDLDAGATLLVHLGMSGSLRITRESDEWRRHDHVAITFSPDVQLRYHDPRRFGLILVLPPSAETSHPLLKKLGPEPLGATFTTETLAAGCSGRTTTIKQVIMDAEVVVGVGNIYASEALFRAGIRPRTRASRISRPRLENLAAAIRQVLAEAIEQGGTTLRDFVNSDGQPGYFRQRLFVYDRADQPCRICATPIQRSVVGQRSTFWCPQCQK
ncbi:MAG: bifunctional DNA-formamidopyrimidine glycosylase/DNA-(apurinic or apyrimidinic site) lyase [Luteolibacter sp.]|jgi:formamidopyrimidine-DNA glycosylase